MSATIDTVYSRIIKCLLLKLPNEDAKKLEDYLASKDFDFEVRLAFSVFFVQCVNMGFSVTTALQEFEEVYDVFWKGLSPLVWSSEEDPDLLRSNLALLEGLYHRLAHLRAPVVV